MTDVFRAHAHDAVELQRLVRDGLIRPLVGDVYTPVGAPADLAARAAALKLLLPPRLHGAALAYEAAAWLHGAGHPPELIDVYVPPHGTRRGERLVRVHESVLPPADLETIDGVAVTTPSRTAADLARSRPAAEVTGRLDRLQAATGLTPQAVLATLERLTRHRGVPAGRALITAWARQRAEQVAGAQSARRPVTR